MEQFKNRWLAYCEEKFANLKKFQSELEKSREEEKIMIQNIQQIQASFNNESAKSDD